MNTKAPRDGKKMSGQSESGRLKSLEPPNACCGQVEQASCCGPAAKAACCGDSQVKGCGCR